MAEGYWVIRSYQAGTVGEKIKYWVPGKKPTDSERRMRSDIKQQERNEANAVKRLARVINENFWSKDYFVELGYDIAGMCRLHRNVDKNSETYENDLYMAAHHQVRLWRDRVHKACKAAGIEFKYIIITSDMDGDTGEYARLHHHVIINSEAYEIAMSKWKLGGTHHKHIYDIMDQTGLAEYMLKQVRRLPDEKKYIPSRNLRVPQPKDRIAKSGAELSVPKGGQLLYRAEYKPGMPQYIRYIVPDVGRIRRERQKAG